MPIGLAHRYLVDRGVVTSRRRLFARDACECRFVEVIEPIDEALAVTPFYLLRFHLEHDDAAPVAARALIQRTLIEPVGLVAS